MFNTFALALMLAACDLGEIFKPAEAWQESAVDFTVEHAKEGFKFASQKRDIVNCMERGAATWHGLEVWESRIYYGAEGAKRVEMSLYNRGDDKDGEPMRASELNALLEKIAAASEPGGKIGRTERKKLKNGGFKYEKEFTKGDVPVSVAWGTTDDTVDYVRVTMSREAAAKPKGVKKTVTSREAAAKVKTNVAKNDEGDVWIRNVPMVDQGQKGYCAVATAERILRYYGFTIDEHELAQMAGTRAKGGTSMGEMIDTAKAIGSRCRLGYQEVVHTVGDFKDLEEEVARYNKSAKAMKRKEIDLGSYMSERSVNVGAIREAMEPKVLKAMRVKDSRYKKFLTGVKARVDQGIPVFWGVTLGVFPEPGLPQTAGGHMRLIIGYNAKTKEILYSDSWGAGHELKRMPEDWAFTITDSAFALRPL